MRVPVSIVVRMNSASNMIAKWYQYFHIACERRLAAAPEALRGAVEDVRHADGQRHRPAGAAAQGFLRCAAS